MEQQLSSLTTAIMNSDLNLHKKGKVTTVWWNEGHWGRTL